MSSRVAAILVIALLISGSATYLVYRVMANKTAQAAATATVPVVMAAHDLAIGSIVKDSDLVSGPWAGPLPKGVVLKKETIVGRGVLSPIWEGEPLIDKNLAAEGAGGGLAATIPPGMRAVAVRVNDIVGASGFVVPGMKVDILISGVPPGATNGPKVKTLLQNIQVLSAGQNYQKDVEGKPILVPVVNLLVTPEQAEILSLASNETRIQLILRNPLDSEPSKTAGAGMAGLFGDTKPSAPAASGGAPRPRPVAAPVKPPEPVAAPPKPVLVPVYQIEIFNGPQRSEAKFAHPFEEKK